MKQNAFYAQSGGVTAVINASACGVIETARKHKDRIGRVYAGRNGIIGALTEDMTDTTAETASAIAGLRYTPGGAFGSARYKLRGLDENRRAYERLIEVFKAHNIGYFFYNGGGDSMDTANKVSQLARREGLDLRCIGVPKTVDNDLPVTDTCPGFGSVAKYVAVSTREAALDVASMARTSTKVFILEVMARYADGRFLAETGTRDAFGHAQLGGVAATVADMVRSDLGLKFHYAIADYLQRSARHIASRTDVEQAYAVGKAAVELALKGETAVMPTIERTSQSPYRWRIGKLALSRVANREKMLPKNFITRDGFGITAACRRYLEPLIAGEDYPPYRRGLPNYVSLRNRPVRQRLADKFVLD